MSADEPTPTRKPAGPGLLSRLLAALLVIVITTALTLSAVFGLFLLLGFSPETPAQVAETRRTLATAQALNADLQLQNTQLQTQVAELRRSSASNREDLDALREDMADVVALRDQLQSSEVQNATVVAEARSTRDQVVLYATAEAGRAVLLDTLQRRSERIERFLARLSDIADDTALDLASSTATPTPPPSPTAATTATFTPTPSPTATPTHEG